MKLVKKVVEIGNGAAIYVPKEYKGKEITVLLPEGIKDIRIRVLKNLVEFMPNIIGVYLYGSYARREQEAHSDIDILVITKEKDNRIKHVLNDLDIRVISLENLKKSIKNLPVFIIPILKEAKTFINPVLIEELKESKLDFTKFRWNFEDIKRIIKIIEGFIEIDDKEISPSHIYSLIMRIRVCYMMEGIIRDKAFNNKAIKELLFNYGLDNKSIDKFYSIYRQVRQDILVEDKITKEEIASLIKILKDYSTKLENETKKKIKKRN